MALNATPYPNISRIVAGTAVLFPNDSIILCDTSIAAVSMTLLEIPTGYWQTTWKLYILDNSNNAATNNITINAPSGYKINNSASVVINVNGGGCVVTISSNTTYLGTLNYSTGGGGSSVAASNTGGTIVAACTNFKFDTSNFTVTNPSGTIAGVAVADTGWVDLDGFGYYSGTALALKPQIRVIGKQVMFRGTVVVPLADGGGTLIPLTASDAYNSQNGFNKTYQGVGGGCTISNNGAFTFNQDTSIIPTSVLPALTQLDGTYGTNWVIAARQVDLFNNGVSYYGTAYTSTIRAFITSAKKLVVSTLYDLECSTTSPSGYLGNSLLSLLNTNVGVDEFLVNYRNPNAYIQRGQGIGYQFTVFSGISFTVTAANATIGAVYSQGGNNFTVTATIVGGLVLTTTSTALPSATSGTLTKVSGGGDATITYTAYETIGCNSTENAVYDIGSTSFTVRNSITNTTILNMSADDLTAVPASGTLTKVSGNGDATIPYSSVSNINGNMQYTTQQLQGNLPVAPSIVAGLQSPLDLDATNPYQLGGFSFRLDGLVAYLA
jgi:hypothetical protein